jgi:hypothetical protein
VVGFRRTENSGDKQMANAQIESDPLFQLLTDALRAGPQSPEWAQAVSRIRESGGTEADEYQLLLAAREDLESGKEYKSVRAGTGFTRELFGKIDEEKEAAKVKGLPTANLLAGLAAIVILVVIGAVAFLVIRGGGKSFRDETLPTLFPNTVVSSTFAPDEKGLTVTGDAAGGLKPGAKAMLPRLVDGRFEVEIDVQAPPGGSEVSLVRLDVQGVQGAATVSWQLFGATQRVTVNDHAKHSAPIPADGKLTVRMVIGERVAAAYANKVLLWTGEHDLGDGARSVGVTLTPASGAGPAPAVTGFRLRTESSK